jgi:glycosyltransferase involved in cell wall biosynthesis
VNVGFYYHVEAVFDPDGGARVPALIGLFVQELATQMGRVTFYVHGDARTGIEDFTLSEPLVTCVDLGPRPRFPQAMFMPGRWLRPFRPAEHGVDVMFIRGPSPLLPHLVKAAGETPVVLHIVGDYASEDRDPQARAMPWWRDAAIRLLFRLYARRQRRTAASTLVLVNSPHLVSLFDRDDVGIVMDSTLTEGSLVAEPRRADPGLGRARRLRLLLTGRLIPEKGLWEAAEAVRILGDQGYDASLDIVGWQVPTDPVVQAFWSHVDAIGVSDRVRFAGYVPAGPELAAVYRAADMYVLPSRAEAFPRAILEAMGVGIPVITTTVGGIPHWIKDGREALLVEPRSAQAVASAVRSLLDDGALYEAIARGGWEFARSHTIEKCCASLGAHLTEQYGRSTASDLKA